MTHFRAVCDYSELWEAGFVYRCSTSGCWMSCVYQQWLVDCRLHRRNCFRETWVLPTLHTVCTLYFVTTLMPGFWNQAWT